jgi:putative DNA primase/helicase
MHIGWQAESSNDPAAVAALFAGVRLANIGVDTEKSGKVVIDADPRHGGDRSLAALEGELGPLPRTPTVLTSPDERGVRGTHRYLDAAAEPIRSSTGKVASGIDIKGVGGLVVGAGSIHASTYRYEWAPGLSPDDVPFAELPDVWAERFRAAADKPDVPAWEPPAGWQPGNDLADEELLSKMFAVPGGKGDKSRDLWEGRWQQHGYPSQSEADAGLLGRLVWWTNGAFDRAEALFCQSALWRQHWKGSYRTATLDYVRGNFSGGYAGQSRALAAQGYGAAHRNGHTPEPLSTIVDTPPNEARAAEATARMRTDLGNAERLIDRYGADLRYAVNLGWLVWDGRRWAADPQGLRVARLAQQTVRSIYTEARDEPDRDQREALAKFGAASEQAARITAMVSQARSLPGVTAEAADFDRNPWLVTNNTGTVNLQTGELQAFRREEMITKLAPVNWDPAAECPLFLVFLQRIFAGDDQEIAFVQRAAGYSLTGRTSERALFVLHGSGANGKSTLLELFRDVLGEYAQRTPTETLLAKRGDGGIPNDVARLRGARLVTAAETEDGRRMAEAFVKDLTGGDTLSARFLHQEHFDFRPVCKVWLSTNHKPTIRGTDNAIWDRIRLIPFNVAIPKAERDQQLADKLRAELAGIFTWMLRGCLDWQCQGLGSAAAVTEATESYRGEQDILGVWLSERCVIAMGASVTASALYADYKQWCTDGSEYPLTQTALGRRLAERGFERRRDTSNRVVWLGLGLADSRLPPDSPDSSGWLSGVFPLYAGMEKNPEKDSGTVRDAPNPPAVMCTEAPPPNGHGDIEQLLNLAASCGWPRLILAGGTAIPGDEPGWQSFVAVATPAELDAAAAKVGST